MLDKAIKKQAEYYGMSVDEFARMSDAMAAAAEAVPEGSEPIGYAIVDAAMGLIHKVLPLSGIEAIDAAVRDLLPDARRVQPVELEERWKEGGFFVNLLSREPADFCDFDALGPAVFAYMGESHA